MYLFIYSFIYFIIYLSISLSISFIIYLQFHWFTFFLGAERDQFAREKIRQELVLKAESGDTDGIKEMLMMIADEAEKSSSRPRYVIFCVLFILLFFFQFILHSFLPFSISYIFPVHSLSLPCPVPTLPLSFPYLCPYPVALNYHYHSQSHSWSQESRRTIPSFNSRSIWFRRSREIPLDTLENMW